MQITTLKMNDIKLKTETLIEASPYIRRYHNKILVIKYGRNITSELETAEVNDIVLLHDIGMKPVIIHGGGSLINDALKKENIKTKFINGLRVSDVKTVKIIKGVFENIRNNIVRLISRSGGKAVGIAGNDIISVKQKDKKLGYVGEIVKIDPKKILDIINKDKIPVISPLGIGNDNNVYNINADSAAASITVALKAEKLTMITNVAGVMENKKLIPTLTVKEAKKKIAKGIINKGMIPKVKACIKAVENNVPKAHLIDGTIKHSLLVEIFTDKGIGTEIVQE